MHVHLHIEEFLWQRSRTTVSLEQLVSLVIEAPSCIPILVETSCSLKDKEGSWRAAWLLYKLVDEDPVLLQPYVEQLARFLFEHHSECTHGQLRGILRTLQPFSYSESSCGLLLDVCCKLFEKQQYPIAVRANAMHIMTNVALCYLELKEGLILEFELIASYDDKSMAAAARKQLRRLKRM